MAQRPSSTAHPAGKAVERVYPPVITVARLVFRAVDVRIRVDGGERIPAVGPAVLACNHVSYLDFIFAGWGARPAKRLVRFMAKEAVFKHPIGGPLMRGMKHIPVDRDAGSNSYREALKARCVPGEVVGSVPQRPPSAARSPSRRSRAAHCEWRRPPRRR